MSHHPPQCQQLGTTSSTLEPLGPFFFFLVLTHQVSKSQDSARREVGKFQMCQHGAPGLVPVGLWCGGHVFLCSSVHVSSCSVQADDQCLPCATVLTQGTFKHPDRQPQG